jgi:hypothetical protein
MLSAVARHRGFPSAGALEAALALGAKLSQGGSITNADIQSFARHYPGVPRDTLARYAGSINAAEPGRARRDTMVRALGFGTALDAAVREIDSYAIADTVQAINARRAEREPRGELPEPDRSHPTWRHNQDAAERRATLEAQLGTHRSSPGPTTQARRQLADCMDTRTRSTARPRRATILPRPMFPAARSRPRAMAWPISSSRRRGDKRRELP